MTFTTIDFETATSNRNSACAVGIVTVENRIITEEYYTLIQPPNNEYNGSFKISTPKIHLKQLTALVFMNIFIKLCS